ncbi:seryl-tRNA synthetase [Colletotrichum musicola]|uniref:serine--tRNA ligase n=1 Tax=Colletotrichum musicola TaxID=2175873 RepID=A0A8H6NH92_9PEZI|nr:seryl-tRNA synthetase [Colletotrichum musicola]
MSSGSGPSLAHRSVSNIRTEPGGPGLGAPLSPHTPSRAISSAFGSPSSLRAEEDNIVIELGARFIKLGFAGEPAPKTVLSFGPEQQRRVGDFRAWDPDHKNDWRRRPRGYTWGGDHELWQHDVRSLDLGLVEDKIDRAIREALTKYLLIDSRPRRTSLVLSSSTPLPLLSAVLDVLFSRFQAPTVSLMSSAVMSAVGAGARSALVVDLGWAETVVTSVYEYREIRTTRTIRGGKMLVDQVHGLIQDALLTSPNQAKRIRRDQEQGQHSVSFEECEEVACRLVWCRQAETRDAVAAEQQQHGLGLPTVEEQDESAPASPSAPKQLDGNVDVPVHSVSPPEVLSLTFRRLSEPCENTFFAPQCSRGTFDDNEIPVHHLIYQHLLRLPIDARAVCMSRIVFIGGCSKITGLRRRIFDELSNIIRVRGWDAVEGRATTQYKSNPRLNRGVSRQNTTSPTEIKSPEGITGDSTGTGQEVSRTAADVIEDTLKKREGNYSIFQGQLRSLESLGPWGGASLACQLKVAAMANVDRDLWFQQGAGGASRPSEIDVKVQQRQSLGPGVRPMLRPLPRPSRLARRSFADVKRPSTAPKPIIDIRHIRENPQLYEENCLDRNYVAQSKSPARIKEAFAQWQILQKDSRAIRERSNLLRRQIANPVSSRDDDDCAGTRDLSRENLLAEARILKQKLTTVEQEEAKLVEEMENLALDIPNLTSDVTPVGDEPLLLSYINEHPIEPASSSDKVWRSHVHIGSELGLLDFAAGGVTSGWGWYYLLDEAAQLEQALIQYALAVATKHGWRQVAPPSVVYSHMAAACGFQPRDQNDEQQIYAIAQSRDDAERGKPELCLAGTSEIPLAAMKAEVTLDASELPMKRVAVSRCYRAEAGARGASTKGLYRVHEFTKVEMFAWTPPYADETGDMFEEMLDIQTEILGSLGLHCRILEMPTADLGASAIRKCDIEAFFPSRQQQNGGWGEVTSASICTDYQTRRLATRAKIDGKLTFPWTVNGTALAIPRVLAALLEAGWDEADMSVAIPTCLQPWMDGRERITRKTLTS